jgi:hypothetical protein
MLQRFLSLRNSTENNRVLKKTGILYNNVGSVPVALVILTLSLTFVNYVYFWTSTTYSESPLLMIFWFHSPRKHYFREFFGSVIEFLDNGGRNVRLFTF